MAFPPNIEGTQNRGVITGGTMGTTVGSLDGPTLIQGNNIATIGSLNSLDDLKQYLLSLGLLKKDEPAPAPAAAPPAGGTATPGPEQPPATNTPVPPAVTSTPPAGSAGNQINYAQPADGAKGGAPGGAPGGGDNTKPTPPAGAQPTPPIAGTPPAGGASPPGDNTKPTPPSGPGNQPPKPELPGNEQGRVVLVGSVSPTGDVTLKGSVYNGGDVKPVAKTDQPSAVELKGFVTADGDVTLTGTAKEVAPPPSAGNELPGGAPPGSNTKPVPPTGSGPPPVAGTPPAGGAPGAPVTKVEVGQTTTPGGNTATGVQATKAVVTPGTDNTKPTPKA